MNLILTINELDFALEVLKSRHPVLVNFWAPWSQPCARLESALEEVAAACDGSAKVVKVNVDNNPDLGLRYAIQAIPTLHYFVDGRVAATVVGTASAEAILTKLRSLTH